MSTLNPGHSFLTTDGNTLTFRYTVGGEQPDIRLWWTDDQESLLDFSSGWSFKLVLSRGDTDFITKTTGIIGDTGSGTPDEGDPNLTIIWNPNDFDLMNPGLYRADLTATYSGRDRVTTFTIAIDSPSDVTWNYSGDPSTSTRDAVRFLVGDTDDTDQLASDQEIDWVVTQEGGVKESAAVVCRAIAARFARCIDKSTGSLSRSFSQRHAHYLGMAEQYSKEAKSEVALPWVSGWSRSEKLAREADTDREQTFARKGVHDNPNDADYGTIPSPWEYGR
jgi:hypothetical protein